MFLLPELALGMCGGQVLEMYWGITAASLLAVMTVFLGALALEGARDVLCRPSLAAWEPQHAALTTMQQLSDQVHSVEQKARPSWPL